jgi:4-hydroxybenzoate polyprenyltransferase
MRDRVTRILRAGEWWDYKLVPILTFFYATAYSLGVGVSQMWGAVLLLLLSLLPGAAYVSVINDITDVADDLASGKRNGMAGRSWQFKAAAVSLTLAAGAFFFWIWRNNGLLLGCYAAAWISFTLYSVPPFRLKTRGLAGVVADAAGAHLFPSMVAVALAFAAADAPFNFAWAAAAAAAALGYGLRGNLWHQLLDRERDHEAGVKTFAERHAPEVAVRFGTWFAFPLELIGLAALFWQLESPVPLLALAVHLGLARFRVRRWGMQPVIAQPKKGFFIWLHEYYDVLLPVALLAASALSHTGDIVVLLVHLLLFHNRARVVGSDVWKWCAWMNERVLGALR